MSLLAATQGTPDRVWALSDLLAQFPGGLTREEIHGWLNPSFRSADDSAAGYSSAVTQTITAAQGLALIETRDKAYVLRVPVMSSYEEYLDVVHAYLAQLGGDEANALIFEGFSWAILKTEQDGAFADLSALANKPLADRINAVLPPRSDDSDDRRFNETKIPHWRRWLMRLDLASDLGRREFYPYVAERLWRVISTSDLPRDIDIVSSDFAGAIAKAMPYLDGGRIWSATAARMRFTPPSHLSRVLSVALRDLHDEGRIQLKGVGDDTGLTRLARDQRHRIQSFGAVTIAGVAADD